MFTKILTSSLLFLIAIGGFFVSMDIKRTTPRENIVHIELEISQIYANENGAGGAAVDEARAKAAAQASTSSNAESKWLKEAVDAFNVLLGILTIVVSPAIILAGWLLSPDWTSGDLFGLRKYMHDIWVVVSNIVYFVYAILLIIIAVATIIGKENFNYKIMLPKMALGILMVPFTWWFVQWTVSLAAIVTTSTVSIPIEMLKKDNNPYLTKPIIPKTIIVDGTKKNEENRDKQINSLISCTESTCISLDQLMNEGGGVYAPLLVYAYQVFRLQNYKEIDSTLAAVQTLGQLLNGVIVGAIMFVVFGILVIALIMVLLVRAIKLWMYAMFSPLFTLHFVAGKELFKESDSFSLKEFVGLCFMPAIVGITLSFGLMVVSVIQSPPPDPSVQKTINCGNNDIFIKGGNPLETAEGGCTVATMAGSSNNSFSKGILIDGSNQYVINIVKLAGVKFVFRGTATNQKDIEKSIQELRGGIDAVSGIFGTIIVDIIALVFIWMAFMAAKGVNKTISKVLDPFEKLGKDVGGMAMKIPQHMPIPGAGMSLSSMQKVPGMVEQGFALRNEKEFKENNKFGRLLNEWAGGTKAGDSAKTQQVIEGGDIADIKKDISKYTSAQLSSEIIPKITENKTTLDALRRVAEKLGSAERDIVLKLIEKVEQGGTLLEVEKLRLGAILGGSRATDSGINGEDVATLKKIIDERQKKSSSQTGNTTDSSGDEKNSFEYISGDTLQIKINNTTVAVKGVNSTMSADKIAAAIRANPGSQNYKTLVTREGFIEVMKRAMGGGDAGQKKAEEIAGKLGAEFFKSEEK